MANKHMKRFNKLRADSQLKEGELGRGVCVCVCAYKKATWRILVVLELFSILIVVDAWNYTHDKTV